MFFLEKIEVRHDRVLMIDYVWKTRTISPFFRIGIKPFDEPHGIMQQGKRTVVGYAITGWSAVVLNFSNVFQGTVVF